MSPYTLFLVVSFFTCSLSKGITYKNYEPVLKQARFPENVKNLKTLQEFIRIVDEDKLNVSVVLSVTRQDANGLIINTAATLTYPLNHESVSQGTLNDDKFKTFAEVANKEDITVARTFAHNNEMLVQSNNINGLPINKAYKVITGVKNGQTGFVFSEDNYVAKYTFLTSGSDGNNQTTQIFHGDAVVDLVAKSPNLTNDQVKMIKQALANTCFVYSDETISSALHLVLSDLIEQYEWNVVATSSTDNSVEADLWIQLKIGDLCNFLLYTF